MIESTEASTNNPADDARRLAVTCAHIADQLRGENIVVLDMGPLLEITDYFVLVTGNNRRQIRAIGEEIIVRLKKHKVQRTNMDGMDSGVWVLTDFDRVVIHIFNEEAREFYDLDGLWADAARIDWNAEPALAEEPALTEEPEGPAVPGAQEEAEGPRAEGE